MKMYGPTIASSDASRPSGSRPSWRAASSVQRSATRSVAAITASSSRIFADAGIDTQASALARSVATAASATSSGVASGTGSRGSYACGPVGMFPGAAIRALTGCRFAVA